MFAITRNTRYPLNGGTLGQPFNRLLNEVLGTLDWEFRNSAAAAWTPPVDIFEQATWRSWPSCRG